MTEVLQLSIFRDASSLFHSSTLILLYSYTLILLYSYTLILFHSFTLPHFSENIPIIKDSHIYQIPEWSCHKRLLNVATLLCNRQQCQDVGVLWNCRPLNFIPNKKGFPCRRKRSDRLIWRGPHICYGKTSAIVASDSWSIPYDTTPMSSLSLDFLSPI